MNIIDIQNISKQKQYECSSCSSTLYIDTLEAPRCREQPRACPRTKIHAGSISVALEALARG